MRATAVQSERAAFVRVLLAWRGISGKELVDLLGCSQQAVSRKLLGERDFTPDELLTLAEFFEVDPGQLLRPPELVGVLGPVRSRAGGLLPWTFGQHRWSEAVSGGAEIRLRLENQACFALAA